MSITGKCSNCGGVVEYSPKDMGLKCEKCGGVTALEMNTNVDKRLIDPVAEKDTKIRSHGVLKCMSCGASYTGKESTMSSECVYCGANIVEELDFKHGLVPNGILPFIVDKQEAKNKFIDSVNKHVFVPNDFKKQAKNCILESVYIPIFEYDMKCSSKYNGRLYRLEKDSDGDTTYRYRTVEGTINSENDGITFECSNYITQASFDRLKPFWMDKLYRFNENYLMGYTVEHPNTEVMVGRESAKQINSRNIDDKIVDHYGYDGYDYIKKDITYKEIGFRYTLYPIHRIRLDYKKEPVYMYINGQTGKKNGKLPVSGLKVLLVLFSSLGVFLMVLILILIMAGLV